jgi:hypothetical protein
MKITYTCVGEPEKVYEFDPERVKVSETELIEKRFGGTWTEFRAGITQGNSKARRVLLWHLLRKTHHTLRYEDTPDFAFGDLKCEHDYSELIEMRERIAKSNHARREELLAALDVEIDSMSEGEAEGKASTNNAG